MISKEIYEGMRDRCALTMADKKLYGPCRHQLKCYGKFEATLKHNNSSCKEQLYVIDGLERPLLSRNACMALGTIATVRWTVSNYKEMATSLKLSSPSCFMGSAA